MIIVPAVLCCRCQSVKIAALDVLQAEALELVNLVDPAQLEAPLRDAFDDVRNRLSDGDPLDLTLRLGFLVLPVLILLGFLLGRTARISGRLVLILWLISFIIQGHMNGTFFVIAYIAR